ncbi:unnamed protein product [Timema podura]|uniref:Uncharacterized protein n=1 Tax=Timema podura TaxID=61482 RepID=A0ABN7NBF9_TIMPD|nr:unnamed protein product [Timema podura]
MTFLLPLGPIVTSVKTNKLKASLQQRLPLSQTTKIPIHSATYSKKTSKSSSGEYKWISNRWEEQIKANEREAVSDIDIIAKTPNCLPSSLSVFISAWDSCTKCGYCSPNTITKDICMRLLKTQVQMPSGFVCRLFMRAVFVIVDSA